MSFIKKEKNLKLILTGLITGYLLFDLFLISSQLQESRQQITEAAWTSIKPKTNSNNVEQQISPTLAPQLSPVFKRTRIPSKTIPPPAR